MPNFDGTGPQGKGSLTGKNGGLGRMQGQGLGGNHCHRTASTFGDFKVRSESAQRLRGRIAARQRRRGWEHWEATEAKGARGWESWTSYKLISRKAF